MKRLKKILKWTGIVLGGLVAIGLVANAVFVWTTDTRLERQLVAIRAAGDPLMLVELAPKPIPPEANAVMYLRRAQADVEAIENEIAVPKVMSLINGGNNPCPLPSKVQQTIRSAFDAYPRVIPLLEQAVACPDYDLELDYSVSNPGEFIAKMLPALQTLRADARVLQYRVWLLVAEGNNNEALHTTLVLFRLARHCERLPGLVGWLGAITIRGIAIDSANIVLRAGSVSKDLHNTLDAELAGQERMDGYVKALKVDRVLQLGFLGQTSYRTYASGSPFGNCWLIMRGVWNRREAEYLDKMHSFLALLRKPISYREAEESLGESYLSYMRAFASDPVGTGQRFSERPFWGVFVTFQAAAYTRSKIRSLRVLNALQAHFPPGSKEEPRLTELGLPAETITDPFSGEPLHVKNTSLGWLVYSVGPNFRDDGGKLDDQINGDVGVGPPPPAAKPAKSNQKETSR